MPRVKASPVELVPAQQLENIQASAQLQNCLDVFYPLTLRLRLGFPNRSAVLYDAGKLVKLVGLLQSIRARGSKALIFTQMSKMLDIFEKILNAQRMLYVRLDGATRIQDRQRLVERFNHDPRILAFISSTRAGGIGLNLTGADTVIFYDTDWNPQMDRQAQDRCHRIGQTRSVRIYRLICESTIEENILLKSMQKKRVQEMVTQRGMFTLGGLQASYRDILEDALHQANPSRLREFEDAEDQLQESSQLQEKFQEDELPPIVRYGLRVLRACDYDLQDHSANGDQDQDSNELADSEQPAGLSGEDEQESISSQPSRAEADPSQEDEEQRRQREDALRSYAQHAKYLNDYIYMNA